MRVPLWSFALVFVLGAGVSYAATHWRDNAQIVALQQHTDSVAAAAAQEAARADAEHAAVRAIVAQRDSAEQHAKAAAATADKRVTAFHDALHAALASNLQATALLDSMTAAHQQEVTGLQNAVTAADAKVNVLTQENAELVADVHTLNGQLQDLNARIQALNHKTLPQWLDFSLTWGTRVLAVMKLSDVVRGR